MGNEIETRLYNGLSMKKVTLKKNARTMSEKEDSLSPKSLTMSSRKIKIVDPDQRL